MRDSIKRLLAVAAVLVAAIGGSGIVAAPAQAALSDCNNGYVCLFTNLSYGGDVYQWTPGHIKTLQGDCLVLTSSIDNKATSLSNKAGAVGGENIVFYDTYGPGGEGHSVAAPTNIPDLRAVWSNFNDVISSICIN